MRYLYSLLENNYPRIAKILQKVDETNTDRKRLVEVFKEVFDTEPDVVLYSRAYKTIKTSDRQFQYTITLSIRQGVCTKYSLYRYHEEWILVEETVDKIELVKVVYISLLGELRQPYTCKIKIKWKKREQDTTINITYPPSLEPLDKDTTDTKSRYSYTYYYTKE